VRPTGSMDYLCSPDLAIYPKQQSATHADQRTGF
jgi:hypothetical protein